MNAFAVICVAMLVLPIETTTPGTIVPAYIATQPGTELYSRKAERSLGVKRSLKHSFVSFSVNGNI